MSRAQKIRCAIYTRKSTEEGLDQEFNSLDAQAEAWAAYIASQKHEGWIALPNSYDDGGISGGSLERPALQRLLADIDASKIDRVVVYKVDRLTRSLTDFSKLVERFDAANCSFVSVTQSFNTATSMGRLTLNMLLSFAQFEREVTAERIRDKIAASKRKGIWMGGSVPLGYDAKDRTLVTNEGEAQTVRQLFALYDQHGSVRAVAAEADRLRLTTKQRVGSNGEITGGTSFSRGHIYHLLSNPIYIGRIRHRQETYDGLHSGIIAQDLWDRVQAKLAANAARSKRRETAASPSPLVGKFFDEIGDALTPSHAVKNGRRYRYYISHRLIARSGEDQIDGWRLPAKTLEEAVAGLITTFLKDPKTPSKVIRDADVAEIASARRIFEQIEKALGSPDADTILTTLICKGKVAASDLSIVLDTSNLASHLQLSVARLNPDAVILNSCFVLRKRGVEARMILNDQAPVVDKLLLHTTALGHAWLDDLKQGITIKQIAERENITRQRVAAIIELAFLAPDIVQDIVEGRQDPALTTDALLKSQRPMHWDQQRARVSRL